MKRTLLLGLLGLVALSRPGFTQNDESTRPDQGAYEGIARQLVDKGAVLDIGAKAKVKPSFQKEDPVFSTPVGQPPAVLLRLPEFQAPYRITVKSSRHGIGLTTEIFFPSGLLLDAEFKQVGEFGEDRQGPPYMIEGRLGSLENVSVALTLDANNQHARYLLLFTRGDLIGEPVSVDKGVIEKAVHGAMRAKVERSLHGKVEVETRPLKNKNDD